MVARNAFGELSIEATQQALLDRLTGYGNDNGALVVGNARTKFRDGFTSTDVEQPDPAVWELSSSDSGHLVSQGGNALTSSYLTISLSPFDDGSGVRLTSKERFSFPFRAGFGVSVSQRIVGQEVFFGVVGCGDDGEVEYEPEVPDVALTGTASITSNVATITVTNHAYKGGDRVIIFGAPEKRLNVGPVSVTVVDRNTITVPITLGNGTYSIAGATIRFCDFVRYARNAFGILLENTTTTNGSFATKRNGARQRLLNSTIATTTATAVNTNAYTDAFVSGSVTELYASLEEVSYRSYPADSNSTLSGSGKWSQGIPDEEREYKILIRARNLDGLTKPIARVASISKAGSTTATVTTDAPHGLIVGDYVQVYGVRDQTNFAATGTTVVASVPSATTFTMVLGSSVTATSAGGAVIQNHGSVLLPGAIAQSVQSVSRANNILTLIGNANWSGPAIGETFHVWGLEPAAQAYEGAYKVLRVSGTTLELAAPGPDFGSITTGGTIIRRTDVRIHFARMLDYTRHYTEIVGGRGTGSDGNNAVPVTVVQAPTTSVSQGNGINSNMWTAGGWAGYLVADIAGAAVTASATSGAITPGSQNNVGVNAHSFCVPVTAVSGTNPTLDVSIEESPDNGTNWVRIYDFPRITATGTYVSPVIPATWGTRYRYVRTIGGTSPSFTHAVNRLQHTTHVPFLRSFVDRSIVLTTLNSTTPTYFVERTKSIYVTMTMLAATTPPVLAIEGSEDGVNWYALGTLNPAANTTVMLNINDIRPRFVRGRVATVGATITAGWFLTIKAVEG